MIEQLRTERQAELTRHRDPKFHRQWPEFVRRRAWLRLLLAPRYADEVHAMTPEQRADYRDGLWTCREAHRAALDELRS